ncbi:MAG: hypothetical protein SNH35_03715 [Rikenellaceae bacterium]
MAGFSPHKKHAKSFNYTPRYYDPLKEEFEKRREELRGERRDTTSSTNTEYTPGQYIRTKRMARENKKREATLGGKRRAWISMAVVAIFILLGYIIIPKFVEVFGFLTSSSSPKQEVVVESEEWNPYRPIEVVPNDYVEE